jgi:hypothetical protein
MRNDDNLLLKGALLAKAATCSGEIEVWLFITYQVTPSLHGGVVNEPAKVKYPRSLGSRSWA